jgi:hypothetical protein
MGLDADGRCRVPVSARLRRTARLTSRHPCNC